MTVLIYVISINCNLQCHWPAERYLQIITNIILIVTNLPADEHCLCYVHSC